VENPCRSSRELLYHRQSDERERERERKAKSVEDCIRAHGSTSPVRSGAPVLLGGSVSRLFRGDSFFTAPVMDAASAITREGHAPVLASLG